MTELDSTARNSAMEVGPKYERRKEAAWTLVVSCQMWTEELWLKVLRAVESSKPSDHHPRTVQFSHGMGPESNVYYLKVYAGSNGFGSLKDVFRDSKAFRALKQGEALSGEGFNVPTAVAAGEQRLCRVLKRAFLLTVKAEGLPLPIILSQRYSSHPDRLVVTEKRIYLRQFAQEIGRLHDAGFVLGDLVPTNVLAHCQSGKVAFIYLDHDRTRRFPPWLPHALWKRNLVQLNRFRLPGLLLTDRMRFLKCYLRGRSWTKNHRRLVRCLENCTRHRLAGRSRFLSRGSFREVMKWDGRLPKKSKPA